MKTHSTQDIPRKTRSNQSLTHTGHLPQPDQGSAQRGLSPARAQPSEGSGRRGLNLQQKQHLRQQHPLQVAPLLVVLFAVAVVALVQAVQFAVACLALGLGKEK